MSIMNDNRVKKLEYILNKFPNGEERFRTDPLFNKVVNGIIRQDWFIYHDGDFVFDILDQLINLSNKGQQAISLLVESLPEVENNCFLNGVDDKEDELCLKIRNFLEKNENIE